MATPAGAALWSAAINSGTGGARSRSSDFSFSFGIGPADSMALIIASALLGGLRALDGAVARILLDDD